MAILHLALSLVHTQPSHARGKAPRNKVAYKYAYDRSSNSENQSSTWTLMQENVYFVLTTSTFHPVSQVHTGLRVKNMRKSTRHQEVQTCTNTTQNKSTNEKQKNKVEKRTANRSISIKAVNWPWQWRSSSWRWMSIWLEILTGISSWADPWEERRRTPWNMRQMPYLNQTQNLDDWS